ncbi:hypothetical protein QUF76_12905 [Desulfobacterales bacterium HSG16]|nr:hypothetical protein [Desulfobacterales bacterium HSG16]
MSDKTEKSEIRWHRWFGTVFEEVLIPLGLDVQTEHPVMIDPPEADVVIIRKNGMGWTPEQLEVLPDGVRDCNASHIIIEFKNTESLTEDALFVTGGYRVFYKQSRDLKDHEIQVFIASSKSPSRKILERHGYRPSDKAGVYHSQYSMVRFIPLIALNDLADKPYNALYRLFGSRKKEKLRALKRLMNEGLNKFPDKIGVFIMKAVRFLFHKGGTETMSYTPEERAMFGDFLEEFILPIMKFEELREKLPWEDLLKDVSVKDLLKDVPVKERLKGVPVKERLKGVPVKERLKGVPVKERLKGVPVKERLKGVALKDRFEGFTQEEIEMCLKTLKRNK